MRRDPASVRVRALRWAARCLLAAGSVAAGACAVSAPVAPASVAVDIAPGDSPSTDLGASDVGAADLGSTASTGPDSTGPDASAIDAALTDSTAPNDTSADTSPAAASCPVGVVCATTFPFGHDGDTALLPPGKLDAYACKPTANEAGPEQLFRVTVTQAGFLSAAVAVGAGVDVDVHLLQQPTAAACLDRGDKHARVDVQPGTYWVAVDTFVSGGKPLAGAYHVDIGFVAPSQGPCELKTGEMARVNDGGKTLKMPATGPIVLEAHLVTADEPPPYPQTPTDELAEHRVLSQAKTGFVMSRSQVWAPKEGGGTFYGAGIFSPTTFPVVDEAWYVNMYWTKAARPPAGTRMILRLPGTARAVVVSAGHETGPGNLAHIGGTPEESHFYLKTGHLSVMQLGIAVDQTLPFGPRVCQ